MSVYRRKKNGVYYVRIAFHGQDICFSTRQFSKEVATKIEAKTRIKLALGEDLTPPATISFNDLSVKFLEYQSKFSKKYYESLIGRFKNWYIPFFGNKPVNRITPEDINTFLEKRKIQPNIKDGNYPEPRELEILFTVLRCMFNRAIDGSLGKQYLKSNPCIKTTRPKVPDIQKRHALTPEQTRKVLSYTGWLHTPMLFMFDTGARLGECLPLKWEQVDLNNGKVLIYASKTMNERELRLTDRLREELANITPYFNSPYVFYKPMTGTHRKDIRKELVKVWKLTGFKFTCHELRHTAITNWVAQGFDIDTVKYLAGHKNIKTTQKYMHGAKERAFDAVGRMGL